MTAVLPVYLAAGLMLAAGFMLPFVAYDVIRVSHRFVGPLVRLRGEMNKMAADKAANHLVFRDGDYVQDLATSFSQTAKRLEAKEAEAK